MKKQYLVVIIAIVALLGACTPTYKDGPYSSLRSAQNRILGEYYINYIQDVDASGQDRRTDYLSKPDSERHWGAFMRDKTVLNASGSYKTTWSLLENNTRLRLAGGEFDSGTDFTILRLKHKNVRLLTYVNKNINGQDVRTDYIIDLEVRN